MLKRFAWNASANIFNGAVSMAYQLTIVGLGIKTWHGTTFSSWALALSVAAITPIFAVNLSSVITRRIVEGRHGKLNANELATLQAGRRIGCQATILAIIILICAGAYIQMSSFAAGSTGAFLTVLLMLLLANTWLLLWQVRFGQYYADERNWLPALVLAAARIGGALGMIAGLSIENKSLFTASLGLCMGTWIGLGCAYFFLPEPKAALVDGSRLTRMEISKQYRANIILLSGFVVGAVSMLVIQYGVPPFMAILNPQRFNAFYLASTLNIVAIGVLAAAMAALLAPLTRWNASGEFNSLKRIVIFSPILCASSSFAVLCFCWYAMGSVLHLLTSRIASMDDIRIFLAILGFQTIIRNAAAGFAMYIASSGSPRHMTIPLAIEIVLAIIVAVPLGLVYGALPLLYGLIFSSLIGSLYSSKVVSSLSQSKEIPLNVSFAALLIANIVVCGLWWMIVRSSL
jgi:hypothetical protein